MGKYVLGVIVILIVAPIAWYLISPIWRVQEVQETSPLERSAQQEDAAPITLRVPEALTPETTTRFEEEMEKAAAQAPKIMGDIMPAQPRVLARANFEARAHDVEGSALIIDRGDTRILRFENFETINGPDLHIYLATDTSAADFVDLGAIRATKGNANYVIPTNVDIKKYGTLLVWCVPFHVLFSSAELR